MITQKELKKILYYNSLTGDFTRLKKTAPCVKIGDIAGSVALDGCRQISVKGKLYKAHRLAFLYMEGQFPKDGVDHKDHNRDNNAWLNLRHATQSINLKNQSKRKDSLAEVVGVNWIKRRKKWRSRITTNGEEIHLGMFKDKKEAIRVRKEAEKKYGFHENHGS